MLFKDQQRFRSLSILQPDEISFASHRETGPKVGFLLSAKETYSGGSFDLKSNTQSIDFSWAFGIGYKLPMGFGIDARYNLGLTNIAKPIAGSNDNSTLKNSVFQFGLFYQFGGMKK